MRSPSCCNRGVASALCWFAVVVATRGRLVGGCAVPRIGLAGYALIVYGCVLVVLSPALCMAGFVAVASSAPPEGRLVLLSGVLGHGGHWWSVAFLWWCTDPLLLECAALVCGTPRGRVWCGGVWPPSWLGGCGGVCTPSWWGVLRWWVPPLMVGRGVVVCGPPHGGACYVGVWPPSGWGVVWWCVAPLMVGHIVVVCGPRMVGRAALVCGPPHGGACCGAVWPPSLRGMLRWCGPPFMVGHAVVVFGPLHGGAWCVGV